MNSYEVSYQEKGNESINKIQDQKEKQTLQTASERPQATSEKPQIESEKPQKVSQKPQIASQKPQKSSQKSQAASEKPKTTSQKFQTVSQNQNQQQQPKVIYIDKSYIKHLKVVKTGSIRNKTNIFSDLNDVEDESN